MSLLRSVMVFTVVANVHPSEYEFRQQKLMGNLTEHVMLCLSLIRSCVKLGQPIFGICRGFQEVAVALAVNCIQK